MKKLYLLCTLLHIFFDVASASTGDCEVSNPYGSCSALKRDGYSTSGEYTIEVPCSPNGETTVYCDFSAPGQEAYTFKLITDGVSTYYATDANSCDDYGLQMWIPRNQHHWQQAWAYTATMGGDQTDNLEPIGVTRSSDGCGTCTGTAMNSVAMRSAGGDWQALNGGTWWMRATTHSEPNGDYNANGWLALYWLDADMGNVGFNDYWNGHNSDSRYLCSTNDEFRTCLDYKSMGYETAGYYDIQVTGYDVTTVYCDFSASDSYAYTFKLITSGPATSYTTDSNACMDYGMNMWIPRNQHHWQQAWAYGLIEGGDNTDNLSPAGVYRPADGCGTCTGTAFNSEAMAAAGGDWQALDAGIWWFRTTTHSEPNGDYLAYGWLSMYWLDATMDNIGFNDANAATSGDRYLCSTNDFFDGSCPAGQISDVDNFGTCVTALCAADEYVLSGACSSCPSGTTNDEGDNLALGDTYCDAPKAIWIPENQASQIMQINSFTFPPEFTIELRVSFPTPESSYHFLSYMSSGNDNCLLLNSANLVADVYQTIHVTYTNGVTTWFVGGVQQSALDYPYCGEVEGTLVLGHASQSAGAYYDFVAIYNTALDSTSITDRADAGCPPLEDEHLVEAVWTFDQHGGSSIDSNGYILELVGSPDFVDAPDNDCVINLAMEISPSQITQYASITGATLPTDFTIEARVKFYSLSDSETQYWLTYATSSSGTCLLAGTTAGMTTDEWMMVHIVYDSTGDLTTFYAAGVEIPGAANSFCGDASGDIILGSKSSSFPAADIAIDHFGVFNYALDPIEVSSRSRSVCLPGVGVDFIFDMSATTEVSAGYTLTMYEANFVEATEGRCVCTEGGETVKTAWLDLESFNWGNEIGWYLYTYPENELLVSRAYNSYSSYSHYYQDIGELDLSQDYAIDMYDSYGDGWHGAIFELLTDWDTATNTGTSFFYHVPSGYWADYSCLILGSGVCDSDLSVYDHWQEFSYCQEIPTFCGDGIRSGNEMCDDGNSESGDGCSDTCQRENGFICYVVPGCSDFCSYVAPLTSVCVADIIGVACALTTTTACTYTSTAYVASGDIHAVDISTGIMSVASIYGTFEGHFCHGGEATMQAGSYPIHLQVTLNGQDIPGLVFFSHTDFTSAGADCACSDSYASMGFGFDSLSQEQSDAFFAYLLESGNTMGVRNMGEYVTESGATQYAGLFVAKLQYFVEFREVCGNYLKEGDEMCDDPHGCNTDCTAFVDGYGCTDGVDCLLCAYNEYGYDGDCYACPANSVGSSDRLICECFEGYQDVGTSGEVECSEIFGDGLVVGTEQCDSAGGAGCTDGLVDNGYYCETEYPEPSNCTLYHFAYGDSAGDSKLSSASVQVSFPEDIRYFGNKYSSVFITDQGVLSFTAASSSWNVNSLGSYTGYPIIAPFFSEWGSYECDESDVSYRLITDPSHADLIQASEMAMDLYGLGVDFEATSVLIVTYVGEALDGSCDSMNHAQVALVASPFRTFVLVMFSENSIQWTSPGPLIGVHDGVSQFRSFIGATTGLETSSVTSHFRGYDTGLYIVRVDPAGDPSDPVDYSWEGGAVSISGTNAVWLSSFDTSVYEYSLEFLADTTSQFSISPVDLEARLYFAGYEIYPGEYSSSYSWPNDLPDPAEFIVTIVPNHVNGSATEYVLNVGMEASDDATLLTIAYETDDGLSGTFDYTQLSIYTLVVSADATTVTFTATAGSDVAVIECNGDSGTQTLVLTDSAITYGETTNFDLLVTAESGVTGNYGFLVSMPLSSDTSSEISYPTGDSTPEDCDVAYVDTTDTVTITVTATGHNALAAFESDNPTWDTTITSTFDLEYGSNLIFYSILAENSFVSEKILCVERTPSGDNTITGLVVAEHALGYEATLTQVDETYSTVVPHYWTSVALSVTTGASVVDYYSSTGAFVGTGYTSPVLQLSALSLSDAVTTFEIQTTAADGTVLSSTVQITKSAITTEGAISGCEEVTYSITYPEVQYFHVELDHSTNDGFDFFHVHTDDITDVTLYDGAFGMLASGVTTLSAAANGDYFISFTGDEASDSSENKVFTICAGDATPIALTSLAATGSGSTDASTWSFYSVVPEDYYHSTYLFAVTPDAACAVYTLDMGIDYGTASYEFNNDNLYDKFSFTEVTATDETVVSASVVTHPTTTILIGILNEGTSTVSFNFEVLPPTPTISSIVPASASTAGGSIITVYGTNFEADRSGLSPTGSVELSGVVCANPVYSGTSIRCELAAGEGSVDAVVTLYDYSSAVFAGWAYSLPIISTLVTDSIALTDGGYDVTITGRNFGLNPVVVFIDGTTETSCPVQSNTHTQIICTAGAGSGSVTVQVEVAGATVTTVLTYAAPTISSLSADSYSTSGDGELTLTGTSMGAVDAADITVTVGDADCAYVSHSDTEVVCDLPEGAGSNTVSLVVDGLASNSKTFTYAAPTVDTLDPSPFPAAGTTITLDGTNFGTGSVDVTLLGGTCTVSSVDHTEIICDVPDRLETLYTEGTVSISGASVTFSLAYAEPVISSISPTTISAAGETVVITGTDLAGPNPTVHLDGVTLTPTASSDTEITFEAPAGSGSDLDLTVSVGGMETVVFPVSYTTPAISSVVYSEDGTDVDNPRPDGTTIATISGTDFGTSSSGAKLTMGAVQLVIDSWSDNQIVTTIEEHTGSSEFTVVLDAGGQTDSFTDTYAAPVIETVTPNPLAGDGGSLTIQGYNFAISTGAVTVAGNDCELISWTRTKIIAVVPGGNGVDVELEVTSDELSDTATFDYIGAAITSITGESFPTSGNVVITIAGLSFDVSGSITIGGEDCPVVSDTWTTTQVQCTLPAGAGAEQQLSLSTAGGETVTYLFDYDYPIVYSSSPAVVSGPGEVLVLTGLNFGAANEATLAVTIDAVECTVTAQSHTEITCTTTGYPSTSSPDLFVVCEDQSSSVFSLALTSPVISNISPTSGVTGPVGTVTLTLTGTSFGDGTLSTVVRVGGVECSSPTVTDTSIECNLPEGVNTQDVSLTLDETVLAYSPTLFTYTVPTISGITTDTTFLTDGTVEITIAGSSFSDSGKIKVDGVTVTATSTSHTELKCILPVGTGSVSVTVTAGSQISQEWTLTYAAPAITSISGDGTTNTDGSEAVVLSGSNFGISIGDVSVTIGGLECSVSVCGHAEITCIPTPASGSDLAVVVTVSGQSSASETWSFMAPEIVSLDAPSSLPTGGSVVVTVTGSNFGTDGSVRVENDSGDSVTCTLVASSWSHTTALIYLPAWQGSKNLIVTTGSVDSNDFSFSYNAPNITSLTPSNLPTSGGTVTIMGSDFSTTEACGDLCTITIESQDCAITLHTSTQLQCSVAGGTGGLQPITVDIDGAIIDVDLTYDAPLISAMSPTVPPTNGGTGANEDAILNVTGLNFGSTSATPTVSAFDSDGNSLGTCADSSCYSINDHEVIQLSNFFNGVGSGGYLTVSLAGVDSDPFYFDYSAPVITSVSGCANGDGTGCDLAGGDLVTIFGEYFGADDADVSVSISDGIVGGDCTSQTITDAEGTIITCETPVGRGFGIPLEVTIGDQATTVEGITFSYRGPQIDDGSLALVTVGRRLLSTSGLVIGSISSTDELTLSGSFFGNPVLYYGPTGYEYTATVTAFSDNGQTDGSDDSVTFTLQSPSVGAGLVFVLYDQDSLQYSLASNDTMTMPQPVFVDNTILLLGSSNVSNGRAQGVVSSGDFITMDIDNVGDNASYISIFASNDGTYTQECTQLSVVGYSEPTTTISCKMTTAVGSGYLFVAHVNGWESDPSTDSYDYPQVPEIRRIEPVTSGCLNGTSGNVYDCPSIGGERIMIIGSGYAFDASMILDAVACTDVIIEDISVAEDTRISCVIPALVGEVNVLVTSGDLLSIVYTGLLSYKAPEITSVHGCTDNGDVTEDCSRDGGTELTLTGSNFGFSDAIVLIAGQVCTSPVHNSDHTQVTCTLPAGVARFASVIILQNGGVISTNTLEIGYAQCQPGYYEVDDTDYDCTLCPAGTFTDAPSATECLVCQSGTWSAEGLSSCTDCAAGKFSVLASGSSIGPTACTECEKGTYSPVAGQGFCSPCPVGQYINVESAIECLDCAIAKHAASEGMTACDDCAAGTYAGSLGLDVCLSCDKGTFSDDAASACTQCEPGFSQANSGSTVCSECTVGKAQPAYGQALCLSCDAGKFANDTGLDECLVCGAGSQSAKQATSCSDCAAGTYTDAAGQQTCLSCAYGTYAAIAGQSTCTDCPAGQIASDEGQLSCSNCSVGTIAANDGSYVCDDCPAGRYQANDGSSLCISCAVGTFSDAPQSVACDTCPAGYVSLSSGQTTCIQCEAGSFASSADSPCVSCQAGRYASNAGATECAQCEAGTFTSTGAQSDCGACIPGTYAPEQGLTTCTNCEPGKHTMSASGAATCSDCTSGYVAPNAGTGECTICSKGSYTPGEGYASCVACEVGKQQDLDGQPSCNDCNPGQYVPYTGQVVCALCPIGRYSESGGSTACTACEAGKRQSLQGADTCDLCATGRANAVTGQATCTACSAGTYAGTTGTETCTECEAGRSCGVSQCVSCSVCTSGSYSLEGALYCVDCDVGTYQSADEQDHCVDCNAGYHQPSTGKSACDLCDAGEFQSAAGQGICEDCAVGFISVDDRTSCEACLAGTIASQPRSSACEDCQPGYYGPGTGSGECVACSTGEFSANASSVVCDACSPGSVQPLYSQDSCVLCSPGYSISVSGAEECTQCGSGKFASEDGSTSCDTCSAGTYCVAGSTEPLECPEGTYSLNGQSACSVCEPGTFQNNTGSSSCVICNPGSYSETYESSECSDCATGTFAYGSGSTTCESCSAGEYAPEQGSSGCLVCQAGLVSQSGQAECDGCTAGRYSPAAGQASCLPCEAGYFNEQPEEPTCYACPMGFVQPDAAATDCDACPVGKQMPSVGQAVCIECDAGWYANGTASAECRRCPEGSYSQLNENFEGPSECTSCEKGKYATSPGQVQCFDCLLGKYAGDVGTIACSSCDNGRYAGDLGMTSCTHCEPGRFTEVNNSYVCLDCFVGSYNPYTGRTVCMECSPGSYQNATGQTGCRDCSIGYFGGVSGLAQCEICEPGSIGTTEAAQLCIDCTAGYYQPDFGQSECFACPTGTYQSGTAQLDCLDCEPGRYTAENNSMSCLSCAAGSYQGAYGEDHCLPCAVGFSNPSSSQSECVSCEPGYYAEAEGSEICDVCTIGQYQAAFGAVDCQDCDLGHYQDNQGQSACKACSAGSYSNLTAADDCVLCELGEYQSGTGKSVCESCAVGKISSYVGAPTCTDCTAGSISLGATSVCTACEIGTYQDATGSSGCLACDVGTYSSNNRATQCTACTPGAYSNTTGATQCYSCQIGYTQLYEARSSCDACSPGSYASSEGLAECQVCTPGKYSEEEASSVCISCDVGYFVEAEGATGCMECETGTFQASEGSSQCFECDSGYYADDVALSECSPCFAGSYSGAGSEVCIYCSAGTYSAINGSASCSPCSAGSYSLTAASECTLCDAGQYQGTASSSHCEDCSIGSYSDTTGMSSCTQCVRGFYAGTLAATSCDACAAGSASPSSGSFQCIGCLEGQYQDSEGQTACKSCEIGYASNALSATACESCNTGTFSANEGAVECSLCAAGFYQDSPGQDACKRCDAGTATNLTGSSLCADCDAGYFQDRDAQLVCLACDTGFYASTAGTAECAACDPGRYSDLFGATACSICEAGYYRTDVGGTDCDICVPGKFSDQDSAECDQCQPLSVSANYGATECVACDPANSETNEAQTECLCSIGYAAIYYYDEDLGLNRSYCEVCVEGAVCDFVGAEWDTLESAYGYWESDEGTYYRCLLAYHCNGGDSGEQCADNRVGALCAQCADNYTESSTTGECEPCRGGGSATFWTAMVCLMGGSILFANYYFVHASASELLDAAHAEDEVMDGKPITQEVKALVLKQLRFGEYITIHGPPAPKPNYLHKLKILLSFLQILTNFSLSLEIDYPETFIAFVSAFNPANLNFIEITSVDCIATGIDFYFEFQSWLGVPIGLVAGVWLFLMVPAKVQGLKGKEMKRRRREYWRLTVFSLFLVYPSVSSAIFRVFVCKPIDGTSYLQSDFSLLCYTSEWTFNAILAGVFVLVYPLGIPLFMFFMLRRYHNGKWHASRLEEKGVRAQLGFLYDGFVRDAWWFEMCDMLHKLTTTSLIAFFPRNEQLPAAMTVLYLYLALILLKNPYIRKGDDMLHQVAQVELVLIVMAGNCFDKADQIDPTMEFVLSLILIAVVVGLFGWFIVSSGKALKKAYHQHQKFKQEVAQFSDIERDVAIDGSNVVVKRPGASATAKQHAGWDSHGIPAELKHLKIRAEAYNLIGDAYAINRIEITSAYHWANMNNKRNHQEGERL